ncbi:MAG: AraC family transcriptional regulator [Hyphomonadaceae bacterium]|nr:AraC family transcriptional regulator [Hyphomonadaceae bacterium]
MDALSDVLRVVGLTGGVFVDAELSDPWLIAGKVDPEFCRPFMPAPAHVVAFHYVIEGGFDLRLERGEGVRLKAGEVVLIPHNDVHIFGSAPDAAPVNAAGLVQPPLNGVGLSRVVHGGGGSLTRLVCGFLGGGPELGLLLANLPPLIVIRVGDVPGGEWLSNSFIYAARNLANGDPGAATVMSKMSELLFVETVRRHLNELPPEQTGWLAGLRDPAIGRALSLLHAQANRAWTAEELASAVNMSRSAFAERFTQLIGAPPMRYLTNWRMQLAAGKLRESRRTIAQIAFDVGYESEAAFTRAFRREMGQPPAAFRKQMQAA